MVIHINKSDFNANQKSLVNLPAAMVMGLVTLYHYHSCPLLYSVLLLFRCKSLNVCLHKSMSLFFKRKKHL